MPFKYLFLPVGEPITDGCTLIDSAGTPFIYDSITHCSLNLNNYRVAAPFIVEFEFNMPQVRGVPSLGVKWLKNGDEIRMADCVRSGKTDDTYGHYIINIKCPNCGKEH